MSRTESNMLPLGTPLPSFALRDVTTGAMVTPETFAGKKAALVMFICRHCPYVKHLQTQIAQIGKDYQNEPIGIVAISSNDAENYPQDAPDSLKEMAAELGFVFPYCYDETQDVAKAFGAVCTPEFYLFDRDQKLAYRGQLDDSRRNSDIPVTGRDLRAAIDAVLQDRSVSQEQRPSIGCNIKWRSN